MAADEQDSLTASRRTFQLGMIYGAGRAYLGSVGLAAAFGSADPQPPKRCQTSSGKKLNLGVYLLFSGLAVPLHG